MFKTHIKQFFNAEKEMFFFDWFKSPSPLPPIVVVAEGDVEKKMKHILQYDSKRFDENYRKNERNFSLEKQIKERRQKFMLEFYPRLKSYEHLACSHRAPYTWKSKSENEKTIKQKQKECEYIQKFDLDLYPPLLDIIKSNTYYYPTGSCKDYFDHW